MRKIISLICLLLPALMPLRAFSTEHVATIVAPSEQGSDIRLDIRADAPDRYVVVKGDTLWAIADKFIKDPWKWPHIWGMNKESIKSPHWIYPGDVIILDRTSGTLNLGQPETPVAVAASGVPAASGIAPANTLMQENNTVKLSPKVSVERGLHDAIPSIPPNAIAPFLSQVMVVDDKDFFKDAPTLLGTREGRVILSNDDPGFVRDMPTDKGNKWQLYRIGKTLVDPDTDEELGIEAVYLGDAEVTKFDEVSTIKISNAQQEIRAGDYLVAASLKEASTYLPRAPESKISARVISVYGGVSQAGQNAIITLNKGKRDGLENGNVLALYHQGEVVTRKGKSFFGWNVDYQLPDERYGLIFVFRVFDKISYALVMQTKLPVQLLDSANTP